MRKQADADLARSKVIYETNLARSEVINKAKSISESGSHCAPLSTISPTVARK